MAKFIGFSIFCSGPPIFKIFRGPLGPGPVGSWPMGKCVTASHWRFLKEILKLSELLTAAVNCVKILLRT